MKIYTSWYANKDLIERSDVVPIGISCGGPRFKLRYKIAERIKDLAPTRPMIHMQIEVYTPLYLRQLNEIGVGRINLLLEGAYHRHGKRPLVLLCFENINKNGNWCHRRLFAEWWQEKTGNVIDELPPREIA